MIIGRPPAKVLSVFARDVAMTRQIAVAALFLLLAAAGLRPAAAADAAKGEQMARQWCANCHVIGEKAAGAVQEGPPNFATVAHSKLSDDQLRTFLTHPHGKMPDLSLTRAEIDDLIAYIDTMR